MSFTIPSYADFAGYALAAASFLALAHTLRRGAHIRVTLLTQRMSGTGRWLAESAVLAGAALAALYATWHLVGLIGESLRYGDRSSGMISIPLWIPQIPVAFGTGLLSVALVHTLVEVATARAPVLPGASEGGE
jgi:TRAP-type C4-dicarboxylate transport system permease small subunit